VYEILQLYEICLTCIIRFCSQALEEAKLASEEAHSAKTNSAKSRSLKKKLLEKHCPEIIFPKESCNIDCNSPQHLSDSGSDGTDDECAVCHRLECDIRTKGIESDMLLICDCCDVAFHPGCVGKYFVSCCWCNLPSHLKNGLCFVLS
jgi:hypothetical protein